MSRKIWIRIVVIEFVALVGVLIFLLSIDKYEAVFELQSNGGVYDATEEAIYIDENSGIDYYERCIITNEKSLRRGIYNITVYYKTNTDNNTCIGYDLGRSPLAIDLVKCDEVELIDTSWNSEEYTSRTFRVYIKDNVERFSVAINYCGEGQLSVKSIAIVESNTSIAVKIGILMVLIMIVNSLISYSYKRNHRVAKKTINKEQIWIRLGMIITIVLASLPLFVDYLLKGHDLVFHLLRIDGIASGLRSGQFPVRMQPNWIEGYGYPVSIFYGDILLYIPAILYLVGIPLQNAYKMFVILINIVTCVCTYECFRRMFKLERIALFGTVLYMLAPYRIVDIYIRSSVGEYCAMVFLPIVIYAFWCILDQEITSPAYKRGYIYLVVGLTGIFQTHMLSCLMVAIFILLFCLINIRKFFSENRIIQCIKALVIWILINAWFLIPFLELMKEDFKLGNSLEGINYIQSGGASVYQLLATFLPGGGVNGNISEGIGKDFPLAIGLAFILVLIVAIGMFASGEGKTKERLYLNTLLSFSIIAMYMSTVYFPYDMLQRRNVVIRKMIENIQFPWRFLEMGVMFLSLLACINYWFIKKYGKRYIAEIYMLAVLGITCVSSTYLLDMVIKEGTIYRVYDAAYMHSNAIGGAEYLYKSTDVTALDNRVNIEGEEIIVEEYSKTENGICMCIVNQAERGSVCLPILYYPGYEVRTDNGMALEYSSGPNNVMQIEIPEQFRGSVSVTYCGKWYWKIFDYVSLVSCIFVSWVEIRRVKRVAITRK